MKNVATQVCVYETGANDADGMLFNCATLQCTPSYLVCMFGMDVWIAECRTCCNGYGLMVLSFLLFLYRRHHHKRIYCCYFDSLEEMKLHQFPIAMIRLRRARASSSKTRWSSSLISNRHTHTTTTANEYMNMIIYYIKWDGWVIFGCAAAAAAHTSSATLLYHRDKYNAFFVDEWKLLSNVLDSRAVRVGVWHSACSL